MIAAAVVAFVVTVLSHEAGHAVVASTLGLAWRPALTRYGPAVIIGRDDVPLTRPQVVLTAAGGPLANAAVAAVAFSLGWPLVFLMGAEFAVLNLVPFPRSDGSRILRPGRAIARARALSAVLP